ncbi:uncharacterized protein [Panulirus ornatus]|uniref:uncharacterized protein isoform X2 n=1 Tax=Panulirus ornatus TaxID=150431 RepID=UPI003A87AE9D
MIRTAWNRRSSSYTVFTNTVMAANEVIEIVSGSSDDEYEGPPRIPIGWNYQSSTLKDEKGRKTGKANGAVIHKDDDAGDDLEIVEVKSDSENPNTPGGTVRRRFPVSSTRSEILRAQRNIRQSSITEFFGNGKEGLKKIEKKESNDAESDNCVREETDKNDPLKVNNKKKNQDSAEEDSETSIAALEKFVSRWEEVNSSKDDNKIREKLWKYYYLAHSSYTHSRKFIQLMEGATRKLSVDNIYVVIKDILDSLKRYKDVPHEEKRRVSGDESMGEAGEASPLPEETEEEKKRSSRLRKVEKKMKEISDKIKELESAEVDLDDETNSAYLVEERLKRQFSKLHDYYCKIAQCSPATGRPIERRFRYQGSRWPEINKRISAWVNKNKEFPDYVDILNLVKKVTKQTSLPLRPETVRVQAQEIFRDVGRMLKERRESDDLYNIYAYAEDEIEDPALQDEELNQKLVENESVAKEKLEKVFQEFVDKDAEAREAADKNVEKNKKGVIGKKSGESDAKKEISESEEKKENSSQVTEVIEDGMEGEEEGDAGDDVEDDMDVDADEDDEDDYGEDCEDVVHEEEKRHEIQEHHLEYKNDDGDTTDDDLKEVLTSACVEEEEEFSEEGKFYFHVSDTDTIFSP